MLIGKESGIFIEFSSDMVDYLRAVLVGQVCDFKNAFSRRRSRDSNSKCVTM